MIWFDLLCFINTLTNENSKKRCFYYHFTQDLLKELKKQYLNRVTLRWAVNKKTILVT
jgi:hypothetical protein